MKFSSVSLGFCICSLHLFLACSSFLYFFLHSLHPIHCKSFSKSLWDFTCLVSWGDKCFHYDELGHTGLFSSAQPNSLGATEAHNSVLPISLQERHLATCSCILFAPAPLNDSCPLPASHSPCCFVLWLKDQTHLLQKSRRTLLGNWCQRGRERSHQSLIISIGGENTQEEKE